MFYNCKMHYFHLFIHLHDYYHKSLLLYVLVTLIYNPYNPEVSCKYMLYVSAVGLHFFHNIRNIFLSVLNLTHLCVKSNFIGGGRFH